MVRDLQQAVYNLTDNCPEAIAALLDAEVITKLQRNSCHTDKQIARVSIRTLGNFASGSQQTQLIQSDWFSVMRRMFISPMDYVKEEVCLVIS